MRKDSLHYMSYVFSKLARSSNEYMREYMRNRYRNKRKEIIESLGGKCVDCGSVDDLELDHINKRKKTMRMADVHSTNDKKVKEELKNIQLLCKKCHKKKTHDAWDYGTNKPSHGTYWMYKKYKCRCDECVDAYREKQRKWSDNRKAKKLNEPG